MSQTYAPSTGPLPNGQGVDAAYHPAFSSFTAPALTPSYPLPGLTAYVSQMNGQFQSSVQTPLTPQFPSAAGSQVTAGNSDLEKLERLKREILEGQNPLYKATPQPDFLASLYMGRAQQEKSTVPAHPEQVPNVEIQPQETAPAQNNEAESKPEAPQVKPDSKDEPEPEPPVAEKEEVKGEVETVNQDVNVRGPFIPLLLLIHATPFHQSEPPSAVPDVENAEAQSARKAQIMDEIARFRASTGNQFTNSYASGTPANSSGNLKPKRHSPEDVKPFISGTPNHQNSGQSRSNGGSLDSSVHPTSYVSGNQTERRPDGYWDSKHYDSRYDHEKSLDRDMRSVDRSDPRYDDRLVEKYDPREKQPLLDRTDEHSPIVPAHVSETVRSITERLANGGIDSFSFKPAAIPAGTETPLHYPPVNKAPAEYLTHASGEDHSQAFMMNERSGHYPPDRSPDAQGPHSIMDARLGGRITPLHERISDRVPLRARISSPETKARLQERIGEPQGHLGYGRPPLPANHSAPHFSPNDSYPPTRSSRPADDGNQLVSPLSPHTLQRPPSYASYPSDTQEARAPSVASYRRDDAQERRFPEVKKEPVVVYERPTYRDREGPDERARPTHETREWRERERAVYPPPARVSPEAERYASHPPDSREWTPNDRAYRGSETNWDAQRTPPPRDADRGRYPPDRSEYDRRLPTAAPPTARPRPAPEAYPPPPSERERYPSAPDYYDNSRVRARSPSPVRRGAPIEDIRPPAKRVRDEGSYYEERRPMAYPGPEYDSRPPSPPPNSAGYYEGGRASYPPPPAYAARDRAGDMDYYTRRQNDMPPPRSVPPANYPGRNIYSRPERDERRYNMPPPRTA